MREEQTSQARLWEESDTTYSLCISKNSYRKITLYQRKCREKKNSDAEYDKKLVYV